MITRSDHCFDDGVGWWIAMIIVLLLNLTIHLLITQYWWPWKHGHRKCWFKAYKSRNEVADIYDKILGKVEIKHLEDIGMYTVYVANRRCPYYVMDEHVKKSDVRRLRSSVGRVHDPHAEALSSLQWPRVWVRLVALCCMPSPLSPIPLPCNL